MAHENLKILYFLNKILAVYSSQGLLTGAPGEMNLSVF